VSEAHDVIPHDDRSMPAHRSPQDVLALAIEKGAGVEQLQALMDLQERHERNEARKAFHRSMAAFRANPPRIHKDRTVQAGPAVYTHASLANVVERISVGMAPHDLSFRWETQQEQGAVTVTCVIQHVQGHEERTTLTAPPDDSGRKNGIQQIASTVSYLERYTLLAACGLATTDMPDDDGQGAGEAPMPEEYAAELKQMLHDTEADVARFLKALSARTKVQIGSVDDIPAAHYLTAKTMIENNAKRKQSGD